MAVDFLGTDEYLNCGSDATLDNVSPLSWAVRANWDTIDGTTRNLMGQFAAAGSMQIFTNDNYPAAGNADDTVGFYIQYTGGTAGAWRMPENILSLGTWYHIVVTHADTTNPAIDPVMYLNGVSQAVTELATGVGARIDLSGGPFCLGANGNAGSQFFDGRMEDARVFNRVLSAQEIAILAAGYRGPLGGEVLWLPMDGARAIAHFDGATLVAATNYLNDMSGNGNHGNPSGSPLGYASDAPRLGGIID